MCVIPVRRFRRGVSSPSTGTSKSGHSREKRCAERTYPPESREFVALYAIAACPDARAPSHAFSIMFLAVFAQIFGCLAPSITHADEISKKVRFPGFAEQ